MPHLKAPKSNKRLGEGGWGGGGVIIRGNTVIALSNKVQDHFCVTLPSQQLRLQG